MQSEKVIFIKGIHNIGVSQRPEWVSSDLHRWYFILRVDKPKSTKRRKLYKNIEKEKLRLAELGIDQELIKATCRYLSCYSIVTGDRMIELMSRGVTQLSFNFSKGTTTKNK